MKITWKNLTENIPGGHDLILFLSFSFQANSVDNRMIAASDQCLLCELLTCNRSTFTVRAVWINFILFQSSLFYI